MRPDVPVDLPAIVDTMSLDQQFYIAIERAARLEVTGDTRGRKPGEDFRAIGFQTRIYAKPER